MDFRAKLATLIESRKTEYVDISDKIWEYAEPRFQEYKSSKLQSDYLKNNGFRIKSGLADMETAFVAEFGSGKPVVAFLGEFDSLSGLSQVADLDRQVELIQGGQGHGCGHQALGTGALAAAVALKEIMEDEKLGGTVRYYGCPGEENGSGKSFMVMNKCFDDCDIALTWHPAALNMVAADSFLASINAYFTFHGIATHAASTPYLGRSALDAVELMNVGANYLREHAIPEARIHYAITNTGGDVPNVVQSIAQSLYSIRAPKITQVAELFERLKKVAQGAALMTETKVEVKVVANYSDFIACRTLNEKADENMAHFLPLGYSEEEIVYARKFQNTLSEQDKAGLTYILNKLVPKEKRTEALSMPMLDFLIPSTRLDMGGTDVGDVSWVVPTVFIGAACVAAGTGDHSWQFVAQGKSSIFHKGMLFAAKAMAATGYEFLTDPALVAQAKKDWEIELGGRTYLTLLPEHSKPEV